MNKLQLRKELKRIGDRNRRFNAMTPERKRVTIAKDVLRALDTKKILATHNGYTEYSIYDNGDKLPDNYKCGVCALGGMFVGLTTRLKDLSAKEAGVYYSSYHDKLSPYFSIEQLQMIECAYERGAVGGARGLNNDLVAKCYCFTQNMNADQSLRAIMQNIIDNNGTFIP